MSFKDFIGTILGMIVDLIVSLIDLIAEYCPVWIEIILTILTVTVAMRYFVLPLLAPKLDLNVARDKSNKPVDIKPNMPNQDKLNSGD